MNYLLKSAPSRVARGVVATPKRPGTVRNRGSLLTVATASGEATKVIAVCGFGPGISRSVASLWGQHGYSVVLLSRTQARLDHAVKEFEAQGVHAAGYAVDLGKPADVKAVLHKVASEVGDVLVLFWNPDSTSWGDVLTMDIGSVENNLQHQVTGLIAAVQAVVPGQTGKPGAAILVTGGGLALAAENPTMAKAAPAIGGIAVAAGKAAQRSLVFTLAQALAPQGIRVAEVVVLAGVKGSRGVGDRGTVRPEDVAEDFWKLYSAAPGAGPVSVSRG